MSLYSATEASNNQQPVQNTQAQFTRLTQVIGSNVKKINDCIPELQRLTQEFKQSDYGNGDVWSRLQQRQRHTSGVVVSTSKHFKTLQSLSVAASDSEQRQRKTQTERLAKDFEESVNSFKTSQKEISSIEKEVISKARAQSALNDPPNPFVDSTTGDIQMQQQQPLIGEEELQRVKQRQDDFLKLEEDIMAVNEIFNDLALMVEEQGTVIDRIADHVEAAEVRVATGNEQLVQAKESKKKSLKKKICCGSIIGVAIIILILAIYFSIPK